MNLDTEHNQKSKQSGDKELFSEILVKENTMNLSERSGDKELFSEILVKENTEVQIKENSTENNTVNNTENNFKLKYDLVLWFHKVNDNNWNLDSYSKVFNIKTYYDILFILKDIENISSGMFFLMKEGISPIFEDEKNLKGGYWSIRIAKKESYDFWEKILYYMCIENLTEKGEHDDKINGISISPKINNCIFKIWTSDFNGMKTKFMRHDLNFINWQDTFYLEHNGD